MKLDNVLDNKKNKELFIRLSNGEKDVREEIILGNLRLVKFLSKYYPYQEDAFQCGTLGLIEAVDTYDISKNVDFASYASICIINKIKSESTNIISMSLKKRLLLIKMLQYMKKYFLLNGEYPSKEIISKEIDVSLEETTLLLNTINTDNYDLFVENANALKESKNVEDAILNKIYIENLMQQLSDKERRRVKLYYGICCKEHTLEEIAKLDKISIQSVYQSIDYACKKMKKIGKIEY